MRVIAYSIRKGDQHERLAGPDVQVIRVQREDRLTISVATCRHFEFYVFISDVFLGIIHSRKFHGNEVEI